MDNLLAFTKHQIVRIDVYIKSDNISVTIYRTRWFQSLIIDKMAPPIYIGTSPRPVHQTRVETSTQESTRIYYQVSTKRLRLITELAEGQGIPINLTISV